MSRIDEWMKSTSKCLFVSGMGGIGKSTLVRKYLSNHQFILENVLYIYCNGSICNVVTDDEQLFINGCEKSKDETNAEYFLRKIKLLRAMEINAHSILVLDNFNGVMDEYFTKIIDIGWKVIAITRKNMNITGYPGMLINKIMDEASLFKLFRINAGKQIDTLDLEKVKRIISLVGGHTLSVELIAKQISRSYLTIDEVLVLAENNGFASMANEKIEILKDGQRYYERVSELIRAIYNVDSMNDRKQNILKILSIFDVPGIQLKKLKDMMHFDSYDDANELIESGWIFASGEKVCLHPIIQETISQLAWNDACREVATKLMTELFQFIKLNGKKEKCPQKLCLASMVIKNCIKDEVLSQKEIFKDLMFVTIINLPKDQEVFILKYSELLIHDENSKNPYTIMELYDYVAYICCQREDFETARRYLKDAYYFAKKESNNHLWGVYYDMLMDYYESILSGAYDYQNKEEEKVYNELLRANNKAIHYMSKSKLETSKPFLAKYILGKAALLIRSFPYDTRKIQGLILKAKPLVKQYTLEYLDIRSIYYMTCAWYYALCKPDEEKILWNLAQAKIMNHHYGMSELDEIDYYYIPAANMMYELDNCKQASELLSEGIKICERHNDIIPFMRKKKELLSYLADFPTSK